MADKVSCSCSSRGIRLGSVPNRFFFWSSSRAIFFSCLAVIGLVALGLTAYMFFGPGQYSAQIAQLESADVAKEVEDATARGDYRFVALHNIGLIVPGVLDYHATYGKYGHRFVPNTSDCVVGDEHWRLQGVADRYAERYNTLLLAKIKAKGLRHP